MSKKDPYLTETVISERKAARLVAQGYEIVSSTADRTGWATRTRIILRRPNPKYKGPAVA